MKTEQEIREKLEIYKKIKEKSAIFTSEFEVSCGAITALEWVLEDTESEQEQIRSILNG